MKPSWFLKFTLFSCATIAAFAQQTTGSLIATVADPGGSVVPGASVTLTLTAQNEKRTATSNQSGELRFDALAPGIYSLEVSRQGFKALNISQITLQASETRDLGKLMLQVGAVNESIAVTAEATPVQTASSERADSVTTAQIENITLKGRDPYGELHMLPGVIDTSGGRDLTTANGISTISINGLVGGSIQAAVDGAPVQQMAGTSNLFVTPNLDAIGEVRVLASGVQAEYGRDVGGTINFVTKSGTSQFHGAFHWDHRNEGLNANGFFNNRSNVARPIYRYMILGGSIGGPLFIPKAMPRSMKNKFFFFWSPEYSTSKQPTNTATVNEPTALERTGDFSKSFYATSGAPLVPNLLVIKDPNTGSAFSGNLIPASRISSLGQGILGLLQPPTGYVNPSLPYSANASYSATPPFTHWDNVLRADANVSTKLTTYFRMVRDINDAGNVNAVTPGLGAYIRSDPGGSYVVHAAWVISPTIVNEGQFVYGWTISDTPSHTDVTEDSLYHNSKLDPPRLVPYPSATATTPWGYIQYPPYLPAMNFTGGNYGGYSSFTTNSGRVQYRNGDHQFIWRDDITLSKGSHTFKAGVYWEHSSDFDEQTNSNYAGTYNFGSAATNPFDTGSGYANTLLGVVTGYTESSARPIQARHYIATEWYVQDNWKATSRLTIDYGMRFLHNGATQDTSQYSAQWLASAYDPAKAVRLYIPGCKVTGATCSAANQVAVDPLTLAQAPSSAIAQVVPGSGNILNGIQYPVQFGLHYAPIQYAPRLGFAWNLFGDGKTVIRGSGAVLMNRPSLNNLIGQYSAPVQYNNSIANTSLSAISSQAGSTILSPLPGNVNSQNPMETVHQWNFLVERSVGFSTVVNVAYVGNYDRHAQLTMTQNNIAFGSYALAKNLFSNAEVNANLLRTQFPGVGVVNTYCGCQSTLNYNALQTSLKHRFTKGLTFNANYQWSKGLGTNGWDPYHTGSPIPAAYGGTITLPGARQYYYGPTASDRKHYAGANFAYQLPTIRAMGKAGDYLLGGWTLSGVTSFSTGAAVSPTCTSSAAFPANDPTWTGLTPRCQVTGDWKLSTPDFYNQFNASAFSYPTGGTAAAPAPSFGNVGLGIMRQPTWWNQDLTIAKNFSLGEKRLMSINFQAYNLLNHSEFNAYGTTLAFNAAGQNTNATTGQYTGTQTARQVVISAKFQF